MVRKAGATTKPKGSQKNETHLAGPTGAADFIQQMGDPRGLQFDRDIEKIASKSAEDLLER